MATLTSEAVQEAVNAAFASWVAGEPSAVNWQYLCRVDPAKGFPQSSVSHTAFAAALFGEVAALVRTEDSIARVTYRGVPKDEQDRLQTYISTRLPGIQIERREHCTLDFALLAKRASTNQPHPVRLAVESEMKPISGKGTDPDLLVYDLVKLSMIDATYKLYIGRVNRGRETVGGNKEGKWTRLRPVIEAALAFEGNRAAEAVAVLLETQQEGPWRCHVVGRESGQSPFSKTFEINDT